MEENQLKLLIDDIQTSNSPDELQNILGKYTEFFRNLDKEKQNEILLFIKQYGNNLLKKKIQSNTEKKLESEDEEEEDKEKDKEEDDLYWDYPDDLVDSYILKQKNDLKGGGPNHPGYTFDFEKGPQCGQYNVLQVKKGGGPNHPGYTFDFEKGPQCGQYNVLKTNNI